MKAKRFLFVFPAILYFSCSPNQRELFNGKDLTGWDTYLGPAYDTARRSFDSLDGPGLNNDPEKVFSVVQEEGESAIRVSGEHFGGFSTIEEFSNYRLTVQFKWGKSKSAPKVNSKRDSGLLYHGVGPQGADGGFWLRSQEFQVQEGDCGDYWGVAGGVFDVPAIKKDETNYVYDPGAPLITFSQGSPAGRHAIKNPDTEKPWGEWNTLELYCLGDTAVHIVNETVNMVLYNSRQLSGTAESPLKKGKIQFQSEGAEVFYRRIRVEQISEIPVAVIAK